MLYKQETYYSGVCPLYNDDYTGMPYDCTSLTALADENNVIPAGTIIPSNDGNAIGVLFADVDLTKNPNGTIVTDGYIAQEKIPQQPTTAALTALRRVTFVDKYGKPQIQKYTVTYDLNGAVGTAVTDANSPYAYGSTVTVKSAPTVTTYPDGTTQFDEWNTAADGSGTSYDPAGTFTITDNTTLYGIYKA